MNPEIFTEKSNAEIGIRFGFVGCGQGGSNITDEFAKFKNPSNIPYYPTLAINGFAGDLDALENIPTTNRIKLQGWERGCSRNPAEGEAAISDERNGKRIYEKMEQVMSNAEAIYLVASYGGGTGTGIHDTIIEFSTYLEKPVGVIVTLPRRNNVEEVGNALDAISNLINNRLGNDVHSVIILDNEHIYQEHRRLKNEGKIPAGVDWMKWGNAQLANTLHELNMATTFESRQTFDTGEFGKVLFAGGIVLLGKTRLPYQSSFETNEDLVNHLVETIKVNSHLSTNYNLGEKGAYAGGFSILLPNRDTSNITIDALEEAADVIREGLNGIGEGPYKGYAHWEDANDAIIYTLFNVSCAPERVMNLKEEYEESLRELQSQRQNFGVSIDHEGGATAERKNLFGNGMQNKQKKTGSPFSNGSSQKKPLFGGTPNSPFSRTPSSMGNSNPTPIQKPKFSPFTAGTARPIPSEKFVIQGKPKSETTEKKETENPSHFFQEQKERDNVFNPKNSLADKEN